MIGYEINPNLSISTEIRAEDVDIENPRVLGVPKLDRALGSNDLVHRSSQFDPFDAK